MLFRSKTPSILVVDDFFEDPDLVRRLALDQEYEEDLRYFKGQRSKKKFLFPYLKEEFERVLGVRITDWQDQPANGTFQKTTSDDPLVWHSDTQDYAAAIYLSASREPQAPYGAGASLDITGAGTSFWKHRHWGVRRPSSDPEVNADVYSPHNLIHGDHWELVDRVGSVYNRLVLWDAQLIHSATSYSGFHSDAPRLVQLFFFSIAK